MATDPVDAVLFDLDETLCAYRRDGATVLSAAFVDAGVEPFFDVDDYYRRYGEYVADTDSVEQLRERCFADLAEERGLDPAAGRAVARAYADERDQTNVEAMPGAHDVVETLARDHRIGLVTNGAPGMQQTKLAALGLDGGFETVVYAGYDAASKPDPEPFDLALSDLDVERERAVHVGNSPESDVAGAHAAGLRSVWLREDGRSPERPPDWTVESLTELLDPPWQ
ncbi:MAG: HAD family hydrolase [Halobacteriales archaeon]